MNAWMCVREKEDEFDREGVRKCVSKVLDLWMQDSLWKARFSGVYADVIFDVMICSCTQENNFIDFVENLL